MKHTKVNFQKIKLELHKKQNFFHWIVLYFCCLGLVITLVLTLDNFYLDLDQIDSKLTTVISKNIQKTNYTLQIDQLKLQNTPIILDVNGSNKTAYLKALETGVAHFKNTAYPGKKGNSFIFGHSSYYQNKPGNYKQVFQNLNALQKGDKIIVTSNIRKYRYQVLEKKIIDPKNTTVLNQGNDYRLTLMTCWPPGRTDKRYIVVAELIK